MNKNQYTSEKIVTFILDQNGSDLANLSMKSLSEAFEIDEDKLKSMTLEDNQTSIHKFLNRRKVFLAMETMEKNPDIQCDELATLCGFSNYDAFSSEFSDYFLIEPPKCRHLQKYAPIIKKMKTELLQLLRT
jgi:AraC-like DNA-binding protein